MPIRRPRILITRSRHQASNLAALLEARGADPIPIPTIAIAPPQTFAPLDDALARIQHFDWIVFTSANAVEAFAQRLKTILVSTPPNSALPASPLSQTPTGDTSTPDSAFPRMAAIGPTTAHALRGLGFTPDLLPTQAVAESLAAALLPHITRGRTRILLVRAEAARDLLPDQLRSAGAHLTVAPAYRNVIPADSIPLLQALFASPSDWPDAITFTSSSTAANLLLLLDAAGLTLPPDGQHGRTILRASIGPITSQTLRDLGHPPHLEAPVADVASLAETLATHLKLPQP